MRSIRLLAGIVAVLALAACSSIPLPAEVDIGSRLGTESAGNFQEQVAAGELDGARRLPDESGECVSFSDVQPSVTVESARIHYNVDVSYDGPELSGDLQAQLYAAGSSQEVWRPENKVGPRVNLDLDRTETRLAGTAVLSPAQLDAVNARRVCWGVEVVGRDAVAEEAGTANFGYRINDLRLSIRFSVI